MAVPSVRRLSHRRLGRLAQQVEGRLNAHVLELRRRRVLAVVDEPIVPIRVVRHDELHDLFAHPGIGLTEMDDAIDPARPARPPVAIHTAQGFIDAFQPVRRDDEEDAVDRGDTLDLIEDAVEGQCLVLGGRFATVEDVVEILEQRHAGRRHLPTRG